MRSDSEAALAPDFFILFSYVGPGVDDTTYNFINENIFVTDFTRACVLYVLSIFVGTTHIGCLIGNTEVRMKVSLHVPRLIDAQPSDPVSPAHRHDRGTMILVSPSIVGTYP